jgi:hypothetical protein
MICVDCVHALKRQYLKEDEEVFCLLDGAACGLRLIKCSRYEKPLYVEPNVFKQEVPRETIAEEVLKTILAPEPQKVVPLKRKGGRPLGWRKKK